MWTLFFAASFTCLLFLNVGEAAQPCQLSWGSGLLPDWYPLIWNTTEIIYPKWNGTAWSIAMAPKTTLKFGCGEVLNMLDIFPPLPETTVTCNGYGQLRLGLVAANWTGLGCQDQVKEKVIRRTSPCFNGYDSVDITFLSALNSFPLINVCHNAQKDASIMAHHTVHGAGLNTFEVSNRRPSFKEGGYYLTITADDAYSQKSQLAVVSELVGTSRGMSYIDPAKSFYFARGHLAPDGDFVHIYEQNATYYFLNVVPQWQIINNGNWKALEMEIRDLAKARLADLKIWTGGLRTLTLQHENGTQVEIYLAKDSLGKRLPVPMISWKVIHSPTNNTAVAVFMINNPHLTEVPQSLVLCPDICDQIKWVTWPTKTIQKGYTYCCDMNYVQANGILPMMPRFGDGLGLFV